MRAEFPRLLRSRTNCLSEDREDRPLAEPGTAQAHAASLAIPASNISEMLTAMRAPFGHTSG
jgi:hypothetical protein